MDKGSYISIIGESGSGKSTLLNIIGILDDGFEGEYFFDSKNKTKRSEYYSIRNQKIGFIFQSYFLISYLNVKDNIFLPLKYSHLKQDKEKLNKRFEDLIQSLNLNKIVDENVNYLSGGEKQRIAIARALINDPTLLICDEPTGNLDENNRESVLNLIKKINKSGKSVIVVTHDLYVAKQADKVYLLKDGKLFMEQKYAQNV